MESKYLGVSDKCLSYAPYDIDKVKTKNLSLFAFRIARTLNLQSADDLQ